jgi:4-hydroxy 2-oxovalerate aldolase
MSHVNLLDTTLRDGSYSVDFRFTAADTVRFCQGLEAVGVRYIEVGHGHGLGAKRHGLGSAAASDLEYLQAARGALTRARFGMFCIPHLATLDDVEMAADEGMDFIRVGTDAGEVSGMEPYIELARRRGMEVMANLMKSYVLPPREFAREARRAVEFGAQVVYIVDSAGCMLPDEVVEYHRAFREISEVPVGFHGHNNLGLAVANSLRLADEGALFLDSSLQGLGRSAGNAMTEALAAALMRAGHETGLDLLGTLRLGYGLLAPWVTSVGIMPLDLVAGFAGFHSGFLPRVLAAASRYEADPAHLILEVCAVDRGQVRDADLDQIAARLCGGGRNRFGEYGEGAAPPNTRTGQPPALSTAPPAVAAPPVRSC